VYKDTSLVFKQLVCLNKCFKWLSCWWNMKYNGYFAGPLQELSFRIYILLSLLPFTAVWRQTWLFIPEETFPRLVYSRRFVHAPESLMLLITIQLLFLF
jgi:hypothetical protein